MRGEDDAEDDCTRPGRGEVVSYIPAMKQYCLDISPHGGWHFDPKNAVSRLYDSRVDIVDVFSSVDRAVAVEPSRVFDISSLARNVFIMPRPRIAACRGRIQCDRGRIPRGMAS